MAKLDLSFEEIIRYVGRALGSVYGWRVALFNTSGTEIGTVAAPVRTDPTGTTTQPVSITGSIPAGDNVIGRTKITDGTNVGTLRNPTGDNVAQATPVAQDVLAYLAALDGATGADFDRLKQSAAALWANLRDSSGNAVGAAQFTNSDNWSTSLYGLLVGAQMGAYNVADNRGERWRNNNRITPFTSALRSATAQSAIQTNHNARTMVIHLDITARTVGASPLIKIVLQDDEGITYLSTPSFDPTVGNHYVMIGSGMAAAVTGTLTNVQGILPVGIERQFYIGVSFEADVTNLTYALHCNLGV